MTSSLTDRRLALGKLYDDMMAQASIERCNCMIRYGDGLQMPARRKGKKFFTPEDDEIVPPDSFEDMHHTQIAKLLASRNSVYIGHMFEPFKPDA